MKKAGSSRSRLWASGPASAGALHKQRRAIFPLKRREAGALANSSGSMNCSLERALCEDHRASDERSESKRKGFSLVELMVALFIFSLLAVGATAVLSTGLTSQEVIKNRESQLGRLQVARAIMQSDFSQLATRRVMLPDGLIAFFGMAGGYDPSGEELGALVRGGWYNPGGLEPRSELQLVTYRLEDDKLIRRGYARVDTVPDTPYAERVLLTGVRKAEFVYFNGLNWLERWTMGEKARDFPRAVALDLELDGFGKIRQVFLTPGGAS